MNKRNRNRLKEKDKRVGARGEGGWGVSETGEGDKRSKLADSKQGSHRDAASATGNTVRKTAVQQVPTHEQVPFPECAP